MALSVTSLGRKELVAIGLRADKCRRWPWLCCDQCLTSRYSAPHLVDDKCPTAGTVKRKKWASWSHYKYQLVTFRPPRSHHRYRTGL